MVYKDELYVGGNCYNNLGGYPNRGIARYDGTEWKRVGAGLLGGLTWIKDMVVYKDELYVCGYFTSGAGNAGNKIMRWDGEQWKDVGGGLCSQYDIAEDLMVYEDKLYIVGIFDCVGNGLPARDIAVWDGERWCSFGNSYIDNKILSITAWQGDIYIGGGFTHIDGQPVKYFARWIGDHASDTCMAAVSAVSEPYTDLALQLSPNPAIETLRLGLTNPGLAHEPAEITIVNALGQVVWSQRVESGRLSSGWNIDLTGWPAGVYIAGARTGAGPGTVRRFIKP